MDYLVISVTRTNSSARHCMLRLFLCRRGITCWVMLLVSRLSRSISRRVALGGDGLFQVVSAFAKRDFRTQRSQRATWVCSEILAAVANVASKYRDSFLPWVAVGKLRSS